MARDESFLGTGCRVGEASVGLAVAETPGGEVNPDRPGALSFQGDVLKAIARCLFLNRHSHFALYNNCRKGGREAANRPNN